MTDVRLTALNPVDSQVYPVACNDKGELLLESNESTGNLNVQGDLTVTGTGTFVNGAAEIQGQGFFVGTGFVSYKMAASSYAIHDDDVNWKYSVYYDGTTHIGGYITTVSASQDTPNIALNADGSAQFVGPILAGANGVDSGTSYFRWNAGSGVTVNNPDPNAKIWLGYDGVSSDFTSTIAANGSATFGNVVGSSYQEGINLDAPRGQVAVYVNNSTALDDKIVVYNGQANKPMAALRSDGSATFAGRVKTGEINSVSTNTTGVELFDAGQILVQRTSANLVFAAYNGSTKTIDFNSNGSAQFAGDGFFRNNLYIQNASGSSTRIVLDNDGNGTFNGVVTAQNITFRLSDQAVAEMPAPLIDEGFATKREIDLLSELIKMKAEIKNLNAFMQKSIQESSEIEQ